MYQRITVIGDGAMATVCALLLDDKSLNVTMWGPFPEQVDAMLQTRRNDKYLKGAPIPESIGLTADEAEAVADTDLIVSAIPTQFIRKTWERFLPHVPAGVPVVSVAKGIENDTLLRPTQIIADVLAAGKDDPDGRARPMAALSGPSVADELARHLPATVCAASDDEEVALRLQETFTTDWFRVYTNDDLLGVELAGATKNVIALAAGILDGLQAGINAKSALLRRNHAARLRDGRAVRDVLRAHGRRRPGDDVLQPDRPKPHLRRVARQGPQTRRCDEGHSRRRRGRADDAQRGRTGAAVQGGDANHAGSARGAVRGKIGRAHV